MVATLYLLGIIAWKVQNDALKRGYSSMAASFWSLGVFFFSFIMLPLYILLREKNAHKKPPVSSADEALRSLYITCHHCGEENPPEQMLCLKCEKSLLGKGESVGTKSCPSCGEQNDINAVYCHNCKQLI